MLGTEEGLAGGSSAFPPGWLWAWDKSLHLPGALISLALKCACPALSQGGWEGREGNVVCELPGVCAGAAGACLIFPSMQWELWVDESASPPRPLRVWGSRSLPSPRGSVSHL